MEFLLRVSYLEIYNEQIHDLLADGPKKDLKIHENRNVFITFLLLLLTSQREFFIGDLTETVVVSAEETERILQKGTSNRQIGGTNMNDSSSRSHTIFKMVIESRYLSSDDDDGGAVTVGCLNLVDLAGSERVRQTGAEGIRLKEGTHINKSLLTLGTVIGKLSEGASSENGYWLP